jgi:hypothetical protein
MRTAGSGDDKLLAASNGEAATALLGGRNFLEELDGFSGALTCTSYILISIINIDTICLWLSTSRMVPAGPRAVDLANRY